MSKKRAGLIAATVIWMAQVLTMPSKVLTAVVIANTIEHTLAHRVDMGTGKRQQPKNI